MSFLKEKARELRKLAEESDTRAHLIEKYLTGDYILEINTPNGWVEMDSTPIFNGELDNYRLVLKGKEELPREFIEGLDRLMKAWQKYKNDR